MSLERIDPCLGYTSDNTVLVCLEFNRKIQWSSQVNHQLVHLKRSYEQGKLHVELPNFSLNEKKKQTRTQEKNDVNGDKLYKCKDCAEFKPVNMFSKRISDGCKACVRKKTAD